MLHIITCLEPLLNCQCCFKIQVLGLWLYLKEILGLAVTVIDIKNVQKQENKYIKDLQRCREARLKVCKQGRNDIEVKVNIQSLIPTYFYTTVAL